MSDIGLILNSVLGVLLIAAIALGWRLEGRLKALRASHQSFTRAVEDLDRAAARAEQGLADLRAATDEAAESLAGRIDRATHLAGKLEKLTVEAAGAEQRLAVAPRAQAIRAAPLPAAPLPAAPMHGETPRPDIARAEPALGREGAFARFAERYGARPAAQPLSALAEAAARNDLILEDDDEASARPAARPAPRIAPEAAARIERLRALTRPRVAPQPQAAPPGRADDDLFDTPPMRRAAGGFR